MSEDWKIKKLIKALDSVQGNGTSLITLIIPPGTQISQFTKLLNEEVGTASNIKSRVNRLSVLGAITSVQQKLKLYPQVPPNGLVVYCGLIDTKRINISIEPPKPINTSMYVCDSRFRTEVLKELLETDEVYGFIILDGNGVLYGTLSGNTKSILHKFDVELPNKNSRGGQSALRFSRIREEKRHNYIRKVCEHASQLFLTNDKINVSGLILAGCADFKTVLSGSSLFDQRLQTKVIKIVDIAYGGQAGFNEAIDLTQDTLGHVQLVKEKVILQKFFTLISTDSPLYMFGRETVMNHYTSGAIETIIVWEGMEDNEFIENLIETHKSHGISLEFVSDNSAEGQQFVKGFGGVAAILRYPVETHDEMEFESDEE
jgi:peptide chain release factor subunit 1